MHEKIYDKETNPGAVLKIISEETGNEYIAVDLAPYKIKNREAFYQRDHPKNLHPDNPLYDDYWGKFEKKCIEGTWIDDKGTWVFMMPQLYYYINYTTIRSQEGTKIQPWLRDIEWITFTYYLCVNGFSGFEDDDKYTSHHLVGKLKSVEGLRERDQKRIPPSCYNKKGELKEYVDPWTFLTRTYLIDDPRGSLGRPLYGPTKPSKNDIFSGPFDETQRSNFLILGARGIAKSVAAFQGFFMHEFTFSGVRFMEKISETSKQLLFGLVSGTKPQLQRSLNTLKAFYDNQPGKYKFNEQDVPDYMGPFYKNYLGSFSVGKEFQHVIKDQSGKIVHFGSTVQTPIVKKDSITVGAGDRSRVILLEEAGFAGEIIEDLHSSTKDSLSLYGKKVGTLGGLGTSGDLKKIEGTKKMYENPDAYEIFGIPNFWHNADKKIGLFLSVILKYRDYEDSEGNLNIKEALLHYIETTEKKAKELDSVAFETDKMYNPLVPRDMLISNTLSVLPKREAARRLADINDYDLYEKFANAGEISFNPAYLTGVKFEKDLNLNKVISDYNVDINKIDRRGRLVIFEPPEERIPEHTYFGIYDPAAQSGSGTSMHALIIYKHFNSNGGWLKDGIAAVWIGRYETLYENYQQVIKICKHFNASVFPEINTAGFVDWCKANDYFHMLQRDSRLLQLEISQQAKRVHLGVGFRMLGREKAWALQRLNQWLLEPVTTDPVSGEVLKRNIDFIISKRMLEEIIHFNMEGNFDLISCLLGLMLLLGQLDDLTPEDRDDYDNPTGGPQIISGEYNRKRIERRYSKNHRMGF